MRIMILSPYTTAHLRSHIKLTDYNEVTKKIISQLGISERAVVFKDVAPWVGQLIGELEKISNVELFSVAPQIKMREAIQSFKSGKTTYYFYSSEYSSVLRKLKNYRWWKFLQNCSRRVNRIANEIKPDVVIAYGTENPVISIPQLTLSKKYPVLCVLQTIYNNPDRAKYGGIDPLIRDLEHDIVNHVSYFGTEDKVYYDLLKGMRGDTAVFRFIYPHAQLPDIEPQEKKYDFVNYAFTMANKKGDEDSVRALKIVKNKYPNVTLNIAGGMSDSRREYIVHLIDELSLQENVSLTPVFECKEDMFRHILKAKCAVLPVKLDLISTTIKESMYYGLPVITNITPATPELNEEKQCVLLAEKGNINSLAKCMFDVLESEVLTNSLAKNGREYMENRMDNKPIMTQNMKVLYAIIENHRNGTNIPRDLLFE